MQTTHRIPVRRRVQGQHRHRQRLPGILRIAPPQSDELLEVDLRVPAILAEILKHQAGVKQIDPRRHRSVRRENVVDPGRFQRLVKRQPVALHEQPDPFNPQKRGVPLIHVEYGRLITQSVERPHPADPQDNLLLDARFFRAAIKLARNIAVFLTLIVR